MPDSPGRLPDWYSERTGRIIICKQCGPDGVEYVVDGFITQITCRGCGWQQSISQAEIERLLHEGDPR